MRHCAAIFKTVLQFVFISSSIITVKALESDSYIYIQKMSPILLKVYAKTEMETPQDNTSGN